MPSKKLTTIFPNRMELFSEIIDHRYRKIQLFQQTGINYYFGISLEMLGKNCGDTEKTGCYFIGENISKPELTYSEEVNIIHEKLNACGHRMSIFQTEEMINKIKAAFPRKTWQEVEIKIKSWKDNFYQDCNIRPEIYISNTTCHQQ